jgi:thymidylate synthase
MKIEMVEARDLPDAWFQCVYRILDSGYEYKIDQGSFAGQKRREFDFVVVHIKFPGVRPLIPDIPPGLGIPPPTTMEYVDQYMRYWITDERQEGETYTYGERLVNPKINEVPLGVNPIEEVIKIYKTGGPGTNQATMEVGMPQDIVNPDPPCLRLIDTRVRYGKLHFVVYFRSWDLWAGFSANLAGIQQLKEYMAAQIGVEDGEIIAVSKGMHLYDYTWDLAKLRTYRT